MLCKAFERLFSLWQPLGLRLHVAADPGGGVPELDVEAIREMLMGTTTGSRPGASAGMQQPVVGVPSGRQANGGEGGEEAELRAASGPAGDPDAAGDAGGSPPGAEQDGDGEEPGMYMQEAGGGAEQLEQDHGDGASSTSSSAGRPTAGAHHHAEAGQQQEASQQGLPGPSGRGPLLILVPLTLGIDKVRLCAAHTANPPLQA